MNGRIGERAGGNLPLKNRSRERELTLSRALFSMASNTRLPWSVVGPWRNARRFIAQTCHELIMHRITTSGDAEDQQKNRRRAH
jgi:hypothetical protein